MRSYLRANSQWGRASAGRLGMTPPERSTMLSSAVRPSGTISQGVLGTERSMSVIFASADVMASSSFLFDSFISATLAFTASASAAFPSFMSLPTCAERVFNSERLLSNSICEERRTLSSSKTLAMASRASKCFFASFRMISSGFSLIAASVSIIYLFSKNNIFLLCIRPTKPLPSPRWLFRRLFRPVSSRRHPSPFPSPWPMWHPPRR